MKQRPLLLLLLVFGFIRCSNSNQMDSDDYNSPQERVDVLKKEIKSFSDFENAEFELFNLNGFSNSRTTVPGGSSWDYKFVIRVDSIDIEKWTDSTIKNESTVYDFDWLKKIVEKRKDQWRVKSKPEIYSRQGERVELIVYRTEGVIYKRVISN